MTFVSCPARSSRAESTVTARCTTVSMRSWRTNLPIAAWPVSAWTKSISSSALIGSATSQPNRYGTWGARRRATSAPRGLETPVIRRRRGEAGAINSRLWIDPSNRRCVGYALHRERVRGETHVDALVDRGVEDLVEGPRDEGGQLGVDRLLFPEEGLQVLHPLEVRDNHSAGVGDDVRDDEDPAVVQDGVRLGSDRGVCAFGDQPRANLARVVARDLVLDCGGHEHRNRELEQLGVGDAVGLLEAGDPAPDLPVLLERRK